MVANEMVKESEFLQKEINVEVLVRPDSLLSKLDSIDFRILKKFYLTGPKPYDTSSYVQIILRDELASDGIDLSVKSVGNRLKRMIDLGLLKESQTTPKIYLPKHELKLFVRRLISVYSATLGIEML